MPRRSHQSAREPDTSNKERSIALAGRFTGDCIANILELLRKIICQQREADHDDRDDYAGDKSIFKGGNSTTIRSKIKPQH